ncbi:bile acid:sodium symporter family protein [Aurantibacter crassamenti]|uniref:bile acid:sodium symporter family protein n=1 Tax=Aurantibacter crassamenti TaxID=1837375 RepID=UPI0019399E90|nr:bile acid:sodium symporter family protein [Aurantibacter crassamenti]MBM1105125.1 bile acid:sodium symporter family protein [Aurantibacter crassamenti]
MDSTTGIILAISLIIIMFGMGLSLTISDFKRIFIYPKAIIIGLCCQIIILPVIGFAIATILNLSPTIAIGIMLLSACPGGPTSNMLTFLAKGDLALSVSLTAAASILTIFTIPLIVQFAVQEFANESQIISVDAITMIKQLLVIVLIPVSIGMWVKHKFGAFATRMEKPVKIISAIIFILVIVGITLSLRDVIVSYLKEAGLPAVLLNLSTMTIGFVLAVLFKLSKKQAISISIETGIQNGTLAITLATIALNNAEFAIVPAIYGLLMYISATIIILSRKSLGVKN